MNKISIITPCFNAEKYIEETCLSVINQTAILKGRAQLQYVICDGKSTDCTLDIIDRINSKYITVVSEPDTGMYAALSKGLQLADGDICAYINAGDYYHKCTFDIVLDIMEQKKANWLTGYSFSYNEKSYAFPEFLPYRFRKAFFEHGLYGTVLPYVQQESTFWSSSLNSQIDYEFLSTLKLAGDYYLWLKFSKVSTLKIVDAYLGGFKTHENQLSKQRELYRNEVVKLTTKPNLLDFILAYIDKGIWYFVPNKIKKKMNNDNIFRFDRNLNKWI
jgi:glycosyltransferase involved in cell wall biosynthesis